jgi:hypothetical protein
MKHVNCPFRCVLLLFKALWFRWKERQQNVRFEILEGFHCCVVTSPISEQKLTIVYFNVSEITEYERNIDIIFVGKPDGKR